MGDRASTRKRASNGSLWAAAIGLTPIALAAVLAACATKAQTRGAAQTTTAVQTPPPASQAAAATEAPAKPVQAETKVAAPAVALRDEGSSDVQEDAVAPETYADE